MGRHVAERTPPRWVLLARGWFARVWTTARDRFLALYGPVEDVEQAQAFLPVMVPDDFRVVALPVEEPAPERMPSGEFITDLHDVCTYLPRGLAWELPPGEARLVLGSLDGTNDQLRDITAQYATALKTQPVERNLPCGGVHLEIDAMVEMVGVRVLIEVTLAAEDVAAELRFEREARAVTEATITFDIAEATGPHVAALVSADRTARVALLDAREVAE